VLVEDALRTTSLPWPDGGRLVIVRALDLGTIRASASPSTVALRMEARLRELASSAVWADEPGAASASAGAVAFRDAVEPYVVLARRLARGEPAEEWFWRSAVPVWRPEMPRPAALRRLLLAVAETEARAAAVVELLRAVEEEGAVEALAGALEPIDGPYLLRACGWSPASSSAAGPVAVTEAAPRTLAIVRRQAERWGRSEARTVWLAAALLALEKPPRLADPRLPARALQVIAKATAEPEPEPAPPGKSAPPEPEIPEPPGATQAAFSPEPAAPPSDVIVRDPSVPVRAPVRVPEAPPHGLDEEPAPEPRPRRAASETREPAFEGEPTEHGGLWFLLPVLARLGIEDAVAEHPDLELPARILERVLQRLGASPFDAAWRVLAAEREPASLSVVEPWVTACRRWCRLRARIGLHDLVCRPALVSSTRTHLDVTMELRRADPRVRRAGLDVDPGWLPWLGKVVSFHYRRLEVPGAD
jgi:hypothetical protein